MSTHPDSIAGAKSARGAARAGRPRARAWWRESAEVLGTALLLALVIRAFVVQAFRIPSSSMEDTLLVGDFLLVDKFSYGAKIPFTATRLPGLRDPHRGDIIVFRAPHVNKDFIKRCVAVGGDEVELRNNVLYVNGAPAAEPYVKLEGRVPRVADFPPRRVPDGKLFMLGDNRNNSQDSRFWGYLDMDRVKGKAFLLYWSWDGSRRLPRLSRIGDILH